MKKMFWFVLGLTMAVGCNDGFKRDNPYDPDASKGIQAPATVTGLVLSDQGDDPDSAPAQAGASLAADVTIVELGLTVETDEMVRSGLQAFQLDSGHSKLRQL